MDRFLRKLPEGLYLPKTKLAASPLGRASLSFIQVHRDWQGAPRFVLPYFAQNNDAKTQR